MLQITPQMRIMVAVEPADFRKGMDGLAKECRTVLKADPFSGAVFLFRNRRRTAVKVLIYDGRGFWLCTRRLSAGKFKYWPLGTGEEKSCGLEAHELMVLLNAGDWRGIDAAPKWRRVDGTCEK
jgi:transposase